MTEVEGTGESDNSRALFHFRPHVLKGLWVYQMCRLSHPKLMGEDGVYNDLNVIEGCDDLK